MNSAEVFGRLTESDITRDYIGRHGEFDRNDEERAICEDMLSMKLCNDSTDENLIEHFGWENKLNYDTDDYADEEDDYLI